MGFSIRNRETEALARKVAAVRGVGLTEAVHAALEHELARMEARPTIAEISREFARRFREEANPAAGKPADKAFIDSLYERD